MQNSDEQPSLQTVVYFIVSRFTCSIIINVFAGEMVQKQLLCSIISSLGDIRTHAGVIAEVREIMALPTASRDMSSMFRSVLANRQAVLSRD